MDELIAQIPYFALEGAAFAGKTTLLNYLKENFSDKLNVIPEAGEYVGGDRHFPDLPFKTLDQAKASTYFFLAIEERRCAQALRLYQKNGKPVLFDRCTAISSLLFYLLLQYKEPENSQFIQSFYRHALEVFHAAQASSAIFVPAKIIYLKPDCQKTFTDRLGRGTKNTVFSSWDSFCFLDYKYRQLLQAHYRNPNHLTLETKNNRQNLKYIAIKAIKYMEEFSLKPQRNLFASFIGEKQNFALHVDLEKEKIIYADAIKRSKNLMDKAGYC